MTSKSKFPLRFQKYVSFGIFPKLLLLPFAFLTIFIFWLLRPILLIQVHKVNDWRIGHFATNTELTRLKNLRYNQEHCKKLITVYYFGSKVSSNSFLSTLWKRNLPSISGHWGWLLNHFASKFTGMNSSNDSSLIDFNGALVSQHSVVSFTKSEQLLGENFIKKICPSRKFVCLNVRDSAFMSKTRVRDMSHHNYRDSEISTYLKAAETLAERGYTVFRMGAIVKEPLVSNHPKVIDYASNGMRTEFLDVYLGAHCTFAISTLSGWDSIPTIFRRPLMFVNLLPHFEPSMHCLKSVGYPKQLVDQSNKSSLGLPTLIQRNAARNNSPQYIEAGVEIRDLSSEELVEAVTEMAARVEGTFVETHEQKAMQAKLKHILSTHPKLQPSPNYYPIRAQYASCFLSRYPEFLD